MSENKLKLEARTATGKKAAALRANGLITSVIYGGEGDPILAQSEYNPTEKVLRSAGYHSTIDLDIAGKAQLAIVKDVNLDPVSRKIINVEFQAVSADEEIEATAPIVLEGFETSQANVLHYVILQVMEEIDVKAKPADLPEKLIIDVSKMADLDDKITVADIVLPKGVVLADKELASDQIIANLYDPAAEAAAREAEEKAAAETSVDAADVPSDNGSKPEEASEESKEEKAE
ncbi:MAG: 50S ribosomal protein L25 [Candidatus Saccharibacteria bacterium]|nr:50S ribosomal protein L25 [Candidatus Saccharibacteria bacterium]